MHSWPAVAVTQLRRPQRCYEADEGRLSLFATSFVHHDVKETCKWIMQSLVHPPKTALYGALELSKNSWLLALQFPDRAQPSLYPIRGGDTEGLMAKLIAARDCWAKVSGKAPSIVLCYEAGYDAFWLARFLKARGIECLVVDAASMQVNRRARRAKTDRIDVGMLLRALIAWSHGERHVWSVVRVPSVDEEDLRRSHRERDRLVRERTAHINRIKGLLFGQGIRGINVKSKYKTLQIDTLVTGDGRPLPPRLASEITREIASCRSEQCSNFWRLGCLQFYAATASRR